MRGFSGVRLERKVKPRLRDEKAKPPPKKEALKPLEWAGYQEESQILLPAPEHLGTD